jgi:oligopeptide transport system ATP-binding protein
MPSETLIEEQPSAPVGGDPILYARGLRKEFGETVAVHGVDLDVPAGGSLAVVGESGSGKTTVARMIVGLIKPTAGEIVACGNDRSTPTRRPSERRRRGAEVQIVFQDPYSSLDPRYSAADAIDEVLKLHRHGGDSAGRKARVDEIGEMVGLDSRMMRAMPKALSGGQRQRIAIARALAAEPRILVLDEAVAALDVSIQAQVLNLLADIRDQTGVSYIFISHDLAVVRQITEDVIVMQRGHVVERGKTLDVLDNPQDPYTKLLRASVPRPGWKPVRRGSQVAPPEGEEAAE